MNQSAFPRVVVLADEAAAVAAAAEAFVAAAAVSSGDFTVALAGGSTPRALYRLLAAEPLRSRVPWDRLDLFLGDERAVPADHPDSNFRMIGETLFGCRPSSAARAHRVLTELPVEEAARRYAAELGGRRLDWAFLGMGVDGHTASLFPGTSAAAERRRAVVAVSVPGKTVPRVTMTLPVFEAARTVAFVVCGARKADMVRRVLEGPPDPAVPASLARPAAGELLWFLDAAAAGRLSTGREA